jgi:hypothetical protein
MPLNVTVSNKSTRVLKYEIVAMKRKKQSTAILCILTHSKKLLVYITKKKNTTTLFKVMIVKAQRSRWTDHTFIRIHQVS